MVRTPPSAENFSPVIGARPPLPQIFSGNKSSHGRRLKEQYESATQELTTVDNADGVPRKGTYLTFASFPGIKLVLESLDSRAGGDQIELLSVTRERTNEGSRDLATVFVPQGKKGSFLNKLVRYIETAQQDSSKNGKLIETISEIRRATVRELWTDSPEEYPLGNEDVWWEIWLSRRDGTELNRFKDYARQNGMTTSRESLGFSNRSILLVKANIQQLGSALDSLDDFAEIRHPRETANFLVNESSREQSEWATELIQRVSHAPLNAPTVCLIDTGVLQSHPLLSDSLADSDLHSLSGSRHRITHDHGTEMAGLALYGDLEAAIATRSEVKLNHRLESVNFLKQDFESSTGPRELFGAVTAEAIDLPEIQAPARPRVFSLATTTVHNPEGIESRDLGRPTAWSATLDALAAGCTIDYSNDNFAYLDIDSTEIRPRLFVVCTGNIRDVNAADDHLSRSDLEPIEEPAQAWNAITVGAYTEKDNMAGAIASFANYVPLAPRGELSPTSRTSVMFNASSWPVKPDVVEEGGNLAISPDGTDAQTPENLGILTTRRIKNGSGAFTTTRDSSAATAKVASVAAEIMAAYPSLWPETVRALVVHSADWTDRMKQSLISASNRDSRTKIYRRYGMGVPSLFRALKSAADDLTLVSESTIRPFEHADGADAKYWEMNLHELPWPTEVLQNLEETVVRMRVTLSYFIKPNPSRRGWSGRYIYPSYGLRFAVRRQTESTEEFRQRINKLARDEEGQTLPAETDGNEWFFGLRQQKSAGSIHTDIWTGPATDLARKGVIAIYPVAGWWKFNKKRNLSHLGVRYSLVVSIESPSVEVDLWTPVYQQIESSIQIET